MPVQSRAHPSSSPSLALSLSQLPLPVCSGLLSRSLFRFGPSLHPRTPSTPRFHPLSFFLHRQVYMPTLSVRFRLSLALPRPHHLTRPPHCYTHRAAICVHIVYTRLRERKRERERGRVRVSLTRCAAARASPWLFPISLSLSPHLGALSYTRP